jgi:hypothetical protein
LHGSHTGAELDLADREGVPGVQSTVHIRESHASKPLGLFLTELGGGDGVQWHFCGGGSIGLENAILLPFLLVFLFDCDQRITFLCLNNGQYLTKIVEIFVLGLHIRLSAP